MDSGKHSPPWLSSSLVFEYENSYGTKFDPRLFDNVEQPPPVHIIYPRPIPNAAPSSLGGIQVSQLTLVLVNFLNCFYI